MTKVQTGVIIRVQASTERLKDRNRVESAEDENCQVNQCRLYLLDCNKTSSNWFEGKTG